MDSMREKMRELVAAQEDKPINLRIRADGEALYEQIAQVIAAARSTGVRRLGFITTPDISAADKAAEKSATEATTNADAKSAASGAAGQATAEAANTDASAAATPAN